MGMRTLGFAARAWSRSLRFGDGVKLVKRSWRRVVAGVRSVGEKGESVSVILCGMFFLNGKWTLETEVRNW